MEQQMQAQEVISIQAVWQIIGQKEWQVQILGQKVAQLEQKLTEALAELAAFRDGADGKPDDE